MLWTLTTLQVTLKSPSRAAAAMLSPGEQGPGTEGAAAAWMAQPGLQSVLQGTGPPAPEQPNAAADVVLA